METSFPAPAVIPYPLPQCVQSRVLHATFSARHTHCSVSANFIFFQLPLTIIVHVYTTCFAVVNSIAAQRRIAAGRYLHTGEHIPENFIVF